MAQSLTPPGVRQARWRGTVESLDEALARIEELMRELARGYVEEWPHLPRACSLNLVVHVGGDDARLVEVGEIIGNVAPGHPLRSVLVRIGDIGPPLALEVLCEASSGLVHRHQVTVTLPYAATTRMMDEVSALLVSDVPVFIWALTAPEVDDPKIIDVLAQGDALIVDSATSEKPETVVCALARFAARGGAPIADLSWARLRPWREALASFFAAPELRVLIPRVEDLHIELGTKADGTAAGALLAGWLASRLGYVLDGVEARAGGKVLARYHDADGRSVRVHLHTAGTDPLRAVEMRGPGFELGVSTESRLSARLYARIERTVTQRLSWPGLSVAQLLGEVLVDARHDEVYRAALAAAGDLLEAWV